ncbi:MAG: hypothetical protein DWB56_12545, partial [Candidatus Jettenia sp.]|nr:hypothetical protein [Candidatus Jettenia sp.]
HTDILILQNNLWYSFPYSLSISDIYPALCNKAVFINCFINQVGFYKAKPNDFLPTLKSPPKRGLLYSPLERGLGAYASR